MFRALGRKIASLLRAMVLTSVAVVTLLGVFAILDRILLPEDAEPPAS